MLDRSADPRFAGVRLTAHRLLGASLLQVGRLAEAHTHFEAAERLLDESDQGGLGVERTARDGDLVGVPAYHSVVLALMGSYEAGRAKSAATLVASRRSFRPHRHAFALGMAGYWFHLVLNEDTQETTEEMAALAAEHEFPYWSAFISLFRGVSLAKLGKAKEGVALVREGIRQHELIGASFTHEVFLGMVAEFAPTEEAEGLIDLALSHVAATGALWFLPELHRIQATLLLREGDQAAAEKLFLRAIELAREQGARHWELRAAVRLADLWREQGKPSQAQHLLAPIYALFSPTSEILDLTQARVLLEKLQKVAGSHRPLVHLAASAGAASS
jgi:tetratricopeptide (TPR) repeat protein